MSNIVGNQIFSFRNYNDDDLEVPLSEWLVYGLKGHGRFETVKPVSETFHTLQFIEPVTTFYRTLRYRNYELKDHLGDVRVVFNDLKEPDGNNPFTLNKTASYNYYPFGMLEPGRYWEGSIYRFGYNGMEQDDEVKGEGKSYTTMFRSYDPRISRWWSLDPKPTASESWYVGLGDNPIIYTDPFGNDTVSILNTNNIYIIIFFYHIAIPKNDSF